MADKHKLEWQNDKIVATQDENGEHLITETPTPFPLVVGEWNEKEHGTLYGVNDIEGKEVLLLTGAELCEHYEKLRLAYLELKIAQNITRTGYSHVVGGIDSVEPGTYEIKIFSPPIINSDFTNEFDENKKD